MMFEAGCPPLCLEGSLEDLQSDPESRESLAEIALRVVLIRSLTADSSVARGGAFGGEKEKKEATLSDVCPLSWEEANNSDVC